MVMPFGSVSAAGDAAAAAVALPARPLSASWAPPLPHAAAARVAIKASVRFIVCLRKMGPQGSTPDLACM